MNAKDELTALLSAHAPMIHIVTYEEQRVLRTLSEIREARDLGLVTWDAFEGFIEHRAGKQPFPKKELNSDKLLKYVDDEMPQGTILVLKDFHHAWRAKRDDITRRLRNMASRLRKTSRYIVMITPPLPREEDLPLELKDDVVVLHLPLPTEMELERMFDATVKNLDRSKLPRQDVKQKLIQSALGLTTTQARMAFSRVHAAYGKFDDRGIELITWAKRQVIRESGALEFWPANLGIHDVGGLDLLKKWLHVREPIIRPEAREAGLPFPRGIALIGIPGTGKSLSAKVLSGLWKLPLLRLDVGTLFGSLLGESEQNMRKAITLAETVAPCILWIDEMEKAFAGSGADGKQGGQAAAARVFGTFLTWMQDHESPVFVVATANDISGLPPELMGRFERTFFLDLPNETERRAIFTIHLKKCDVAFPEKEFDYRELLSKSDGMVGREIERAVREAQAVSYADGNREIEQQDLITSLAETVPLSRSHADVIDELRKWKTDGRAAPASSEEQPKDTGGRFGDV